MLTIDLLPTIDTFLYVILKRQKKLSKNNFILKKINSLKKGEGVPHLNFERGPGVPLLIFEQGPEVPLLNFRGVSGPTFIPCCFFPNKMSGCTL